MSELSEQCEVLRLWAKQLREGEPILASDLREAADTILNLRDTAQQAQSENAKLRELVREMWAYAEQELLCDENCSYGAVCDWRDCVFKRRMRELGVEVDG